MSLLLQLAAALASLAGPQDVVPPPMPPQVPADDAFLAVDGKPSEPGRVPEGTSDAARARWALLVASGQVKGQAPTPIGGLRLRFDAQLRESANTMRKDIDIAFEYLEQGRGYLKTIFEGSRRISARGPSGDWMIDGGEVVDLGGRGDKTSRANHERWLAFTRNFCSLADPTASRLVRLEALDPRPAGENAIVERVRLGNETIIHFPTRAMADLARQLTWLVVDSPDFAVQDVTEDRLGDTAGIVRVRLGIDPKSGRIRLAQIVPLGLGVPDETRAVIVAVPRWTDALGGVWLPENLLVFRRDRERGPLVYDPAASADLYLKRVGSTINPPLTGRDFERPE